MEKIGFIILVCILAACLILPGCAQSEISSQPAISKSPPVTQSLEPSATNEPQLNELDYFPMDVGMEWTYNIKVGKAQPRIYENIYAKKSEGSFSFPMTGPFTASEGLEYRLKLKIKNAYMPDKILSAFELEVLEDGIGFFRNNTKLVWSIQGFGNNAAVVQGAEYANGNIMQIYPYPELKSAEKITSQRIIFLWGKGRIVQEDRDSFGYKGIDKNVPGYEGIACWHFLREVNPAKFEGAKPFTEDYWYAPKKGLVRLEQKVEGITSMVWTLE
jgi:hypothetical protein